MIPPPVVPRHQAWILNSAFNRNSKEVGTFSSEWLRVWRSQRQVGG